MRFKRKSSEDPGIDISPLIDMVFILLIFFMVSTTFVKDMDIDIDRPEASSATISSTKAIRLYIGKDGTTYMDDEAVRTWMIQSRLRERLGRSKDDPVLVITDEGVAADRLIEVVDQARLAGALDIGVATELEVGR
jgi:biopolymer transport protein ExbD